MFKLRIGNFSYEFRANSLSGAKRIASNIFWCNSALGRKLWNDYKFGHPNFIYLDEYLDFDEIRIHSYCTLANSSGWLN